jgi:hypothetical protein
LGTFSIKKDVAQHDNRVSFTNVQELVGLDYVYSNGASSRKLMVESTGGGAGWIDFDLDGLIDVYFPQGGNPVTTKENLSEQPPDRLYRNEINQPGSTPHFVDVSLAAIPREYGFGQGIAVGDYDNDGFPDIYVTNVGPNVLLRNLGDGTFEDVTEIARVGNKQWSTSCAWGDLDLDGDLDLWVCNYLIYDSYKPFPCPGESGEPATCHPGQIEPRPNEVYINNGDGTFQPVYDKWKLNAKGGKSLGVVISDFDRDGWPDVFVANDTTSNFLYLNQGPDPDAPEGELRIRFSESGNAKGCAMSGLGEYQASMGIGFGDFDHNGFQDLYITHFTSDSNTLYANLGSKGFLSRTSADRPKSKAEYLGFHDRTREGGLHRPVFNYLAFGTVMVDFDCDRNQELLVTNGHIDDWRATNEDLWKMPAQLFSYTGTIWQDCSAESGDFFKEERIGRGMASADFDNDNDVDVLIIHQNDPVALLRNDSESGHWLRIRLVGIDSNRDGLNAVVTIKQGDEFLVQERVSGTSYCASHEPVLTFGLGEIDSAATVEIEWPSGTNQVLKNVEIDQSIVILEAL